MDVKEGVKKLGLVYGPSLLEYDFGPHHPFSSRRAMVTWELLKSLGLLDHPEMLVLEPQEASDEELAHFHTHNFINFVREACHRGYGFLDGGDTPAMPGGFTAASTVVGSSWKVVDAVASGQVRYGATIVGGLHHAFPGRAAGFCVFNDMAVAAHLLRKKYNLKRIAYIDIDAHHGDGVVYGFYEDMDMLTIDLHEDGRYLFPGTGDLHEVGKGNGYGTKFNIPMPPFSGDQSFIQVFDDLVPQLMMDFRPQFIFLQMGVDGHGGDPLTNLNYSAASYRHAARVTRNLAEQFCEGRLVLFSGGGYNMESCALRWTEMLATMLDAELPDELPEEWRARFKEITGDEAPTTFNEQYTTDNTHSRVSHMVNWLREKGLLGW